MGKMVGCCGAECKRVRPRGGGQFAHRAVSPLFILVLRFARQVSVPPGEGSPHAQQNRATAPSEPARRQHDRGNPGRRGQRGPGVGRPGQRSGDAAGAVQQPAGYAGRTGGADCEPPDDQRDLSELDAGAEDRFRHRADRTGHSRQSSAARVSGQSEFLLQRGRPADGAEHPALGYRRGGRDLRQHPAGRDEDGFRRDQRLSARLRHVARADRLRLAIRRPIRCLLRSTTIHSPRRTRRRSPRRINRRRARSA